MGYADLALIITANNEYHLMTNGNDSLRRLNNWVAANKLQLAPEKSEAVIFKWKEKKVYHIHNGSSAKENAY